MPLDIDQELIAKTPGGIGGAGGLGSATGGGGLDIAGLLHGLLGEKTPSPGGVVGQGLQGEDLMGAPQMNGPREGGLLSGLANQVTDSRLGQGVSQLGQGMSRLFGRR
jgi:hypothetical protein